MAMCCQRRWVTPWRVNGAGWVRVLSEVAFSLATLASRGFSLLDGETAHVVAVKLGALGLLPREHRPDPAILQVRCRAPSVQHLVLARSCTALTITISARPHSLARPLCGAAASSTLSASRRASTKTPSASTACSPWALASWRSVRQTPPTSAPSFRLAATHPHPV